MINYAVFYLNNSGDLRYLFIPYRDENTTINCPPELYTKTIEDVINLTIRYVSDTFIVHETMLDKESFFKAHPKIFTQYYNKLKYAGHN